MTRRRPLILLFLTIVLTLVFFIYSPPINSYQALVTCDTESVNSVAAIQQDDPCILNLIRSQFLHPPSLKNLNLDPPVVENPSMGQAQSILEILKNQEKGFFIECGALDGQVRSNTLFMEQHLGWQGILIEADPKNYQKLLKKNRRAWSVPACLSTSPNPKTVAFKQAFNMGRISQAKPGPDSIQVQCFPLFSILSALNRTQVDYFSLDIEGDELAVLETIPWNRVDIETLSVEFIHGREGKETLKKYMEQQGYQVVKTITHWNMLANDFIFKKIS
ncbi:hypothetical protein DAPPUDRAFT_302580 [Daphnia pulex]|uniref:Methyltransferase FkbM domain-containing protein n=1 Tax=Daphnia pulex TaxID=6669 RepID=E9GEJ2_DAPPU|nr:hypothetical protein DAPPUDRAFT_302580 [Daphnia pulex]|eukprot:EFX82300.1 hypothetical protein DAPPUDRAFT_302580 [Daphnia pulex]